LGTSGWSYKEWVGPFYRNDEESKLRAYTEVFGTAEIDSTFYAYPAKGLVMGWKMNTPEKFLFTAKLPKVITHEKMLDLSQGADQDLMRFVDLMGPLTGANKLGCLLIQLPPSFSYDPGRLEAFFRIMPKGLRFAAEFRNKSWMRDETWELLKGYNVAYVNVDEPLLPPEVHITADFAYFRWHGYGKNVWFDYSYSKEELEPWVPKVKVAAGKVKEVYGYFNNHFHGYAVENCLQVMEMLGVAGDAQRDAKEKIESYRVSSENIKDKTKHKGKAGGTLDVFMKK
jgi:uncharacterized protein YecE (DUF72 family)